jgi:quercetin dioxygenase-like cupin family protein
MLKSMKLGGLTIAALAVWTGTQMGGEKGTGHADKAHVMVTPSDIKWGPAPPSLPAGAQVAALVGDPGKAGPYVMRIKLPDGYKIPPHWHPSDENVTVLKGTLMVGKGDTFSSAASKPLPAGSYMRMPKQMHHFAWAKGETILQLHGIEPFQITYINPSDDPRKK